MRQFYKCFKFLIDPNPAYSEHNAIRYTVKETVRRSASSMCTVYIKNQTNNALYVLQVNHEFTVCNFIKKIIMKFLLPYYFFNQY